MSDPSHSSPTGPSGPPPAPAPRVRDRQVVLVSALVVVVVLGAQALGILVPAFDDLLGFQPAVIVLLIVVTLVVLAGSLRAAMRRG